MNQNLLVPLAIIAVGVLIGGVLLFSGGDSGNSPELDTTSANLRKVDLEINNMFCIGCRSSVVNSVLSLPGVVRADADPRTDSGWVVYDSDITSKEQIVSASVFQAYTARILDDNPIDDSTIANQATASEMPKEIEGKLNQLAQRLNEKQVSLDQFTQNELDETILQGDFEKANNLLDNLLLAY